MHVGYRDNFLAHPRPEMSRTGLDFRGQRKDGTQFPAEVSLSPIDTDDGVLVVAVVRDVTQRREAEQRIAFEKMLADPDSSDYQDFFKQLKPIEKKLARKGGRTFEQAMWRVFQEN